MIYRYFYALLTGALALGMCGCITSKAGKKISVADMDTLLLEDGPSVTVNTVFHVPEKAFSKRSRLIVVPLLVAEGRVQAEGTPLVFDAPIFSKKLEREKVLEGYVDTLGYVAQAIDQTRAFEVPYRELLPVPSHVHSGRIIAVVSTDGCGECSAIDTLDVASFNEPLLPWMEPRFVNRPKIRKGAGSALIQFVINRYEIRPELADNRRELGRMVADLQKVAADTLATLNTLDIYGMASADGPYHFNTTLAENRAASARDWLVKQIGKEAFADCHTGIGSRPEGWKPVLEAMIADGHSDSVRVKEILERYDAPNDDVAERHIRRLKCWPDIRERYLQKDRKVEYEYTYTIRSFVTDAELLRVYQARPDALSEEEMLRVAVLKTDLVEQQAVYRTVLEYFPGSEVAANNLAVLLQREGKYAEARRFLQDWKMRHAATDVKKGGDAHE